VHPDYMSFDRKKGPSEYSVELYEQFLTYVRRRYANDGWFVLPRDVATHVRRYQVGSSEAATGGSRSGTRSRSLTSRRRASVTAAAASAATAGGDPSGPP